MDFYKKCCLPPKVVDVFNSGAAANIPRAVAVQSKRWVPGETINYWVDQHSDRSEVVSAFSEWSLHANLDFVLVGNRSEAAIRVEFNYGLGSWSYIGTDAKNISTSQATMNIGWSLQGGDPTALHEVGHALGLGHEHQSPNRTIEFDADRLYREFAAQGWSRQDVDSNILDTMATDGATKYDTESIMHYSFPPQHILSPEPYASRGIGVNTDLTEIDIDWAETVYPSAVVYDTGLEPMRLYEVLETPHVFDVTPQKSGFISFAAINVGLARAIATEKTERHTRFVSGVHNLRKQSSVLLDDFAVEAGKEYKINLQSFGSVGGAFVYWEGSI